MMMSLGKASAAATSRGTSEARCWPSPSMLSTPSMLMAVGGVSGFTVGLFCGRAVRLQRALTALRRDKGIVLP